MIYFSLSNSLQLQYDGILTRLKGNFVSKEVYLLKGNVLTALGRPYSVCISLKDGEVSEERAFEQWNGIDEIMNSELPMIAEGTLMGELMRYLLMRLRRVLRIAPFADEYMLDVLRGKLNDKFRFYDIMLLKSDTLVSDMRIRGVISEAEKVLRTISEPAESEEALKDMDLPYMARLMGLCRYEEAAALYEDALSRVDVSSIIGTELALCLAETYYFLERPEDSVSWYLKCDRRYIKDMDDYRLRLGYALMDAGHIPADEQDASDYTKKSGLIKVYCKGLLNPTFKKYNSD
ncbi:MAG: hypothetical protein IK123_09575, partial [Lachnospiraceae bacterium]|nr:hypothetical protein [Lachnospiraceae bacterium]